MGTSEAATSSREAALMNKSDTHLIVGLLCINISYVASMGILWNIAALINLVAFFIYLARGE